MNKQKLIGALPKKKEAVSKEFYGYEFYNEAIDDCIEVIQEFDPFAPDWNSAPDWAVAHAVDADGQGVWYGKNTIETEDYLWVFPESDQEWHEFQKSKVYDVMDWKQSKRTPTIEQIASKYGISTEVVQGIMKVLQTTGHMNETKQT
jgi:hypothetical protein